MLFVEAGSTLFRAVKTDGGGGVLAWWAVVGSGAAVLSRIVGEPIHTSSAGDSIAKALVARQLAVLAGIQLNIEVLVAGTLEAVQLAIVAVLGEPNRACFDTSIWRHQRIALVVASEAKKPCC